MMHRVLSVLALTLLVAGAARADGTLTFELDGKPVTRVPVDRLGEVTAKLALGASVKAVVGEQFGAFRHELVLTAWHFGSAGEVGYSGSERWSKAAIAQSESSASFGALTGASSPFLKSGIALNLHEAHSGETLAIAAHYHREVPTGRMILVEGQLVPELVWEVGLGLAQGTLGLDAPAAKLQADTAKLGATAVKAMTSAGLPGFFASELIQRFDAEGAVIGAGSAEAAIGAMMQQMEAGAIGDDAKKTESTFDGSQVANAKLGPIAGYSWNLIDGSHWLYATLTVDATLNLVRVDPGHTEKASYTCTGLLMTAKTKLGGAASWVLEPEKDANAKDKCTRR